MGAKEQSSVAGMLYIRMLKAMVLGAALLVVLMHSQTSGHSSSDTRGVSAERLSTSLQHSVALNPADDQTVLQPALQAQQQQQQLPPAHINFTTKSRQWFLANPSTHCRRHEVPAKGQISVSPFLNDHTFRSMADHTYGGRGDNTKLKPPGADWRPQDVKTGDIIYVWTDALKKFFRDRHSKINSTYILLTHGSPWHVPRDERSHRACTADTCSRYLQDPQLGHWYGKNMIQGYGSKTTPIPVGIPSADENYVTPWRDRDTLLQLALAAPAWKQRNTTLYINWENKNHKGRGEVEKQLMELPGVLRVSKRLDYATYLQHMANSKFVAAPAGKGFDTYRAWEAMYLGAVPIIQKGPLDWLYKGLPVLLVDSFSKVDQQLLDSYEARWTEEQNTAKAWAVYWHLELQRKQQELRSRAAAQ